MTAAYMKAAQLDNTRMEKLRAIEKELGAWVVAVEPQAEIAHLSDDQLSRLRAAEKELGVILLAYQPPTTKH
jgi:hypothetical protein